MTINFDEFELLPCLKGGRIDPDTVLATVYPARGKATAAQLNIKLGKDVQDAAGWKTGDKIEFRYNVGKRQILLKRGSAGYQLRSDGAFRRSITRGWHLEPFGQGAMRARPLEILHNNDGMLILQVPEEITHD